MSVFPHLLFSCELKQVYIYTHSILAEYLLTFCLLKKIYTHRSRWWAGGYPQTKENKQAQGPHPLQQDIREVLEDFVLTKIYNGMHLRHMIPL